MWKNQDDTICKWKILYKLISGEKFQQKKKRLKTFVLLENNQPRPQCLAKRKKTLKELLSWNVKILNTWSWAKLEYQRSQNYLDFTYQIIRIILIKEGWPKRYFIDEVDTRKNKK